MLCGFYLPSSAKVFQILVASSARMAEIETKMARPHIQPYVLYARCATSCFTPCLPDSALRADRRPFLWPQILRGLQSLAIMHLAYPCAHGITKILSRHCDLSVAITKQREIQCRVAPNQTQLEHVAQL